MDLQQTIYSDPGLETEVDPDPKHPSIMLHKPDSAFSPFVKLFLTPGQLITLHAQIEYALDQWNKQELHKLAVPGPLPEATIVIKEFTELPE